MSVTAAGWLPMAAASEPPLDPDADEARDQLANELAKNEYLQARPNPIDHAIDSFWGWVSELIQNLGNAGGGFSFAGIIIVLVVIALVLAFILYFGRFAPTSRSSLARTSATAVFEDDGRSARQLRKAAGLAAANGDYALATVEQFRALARELAERTIIAMQPGSTSHDVAQRAATAFPAEQNALMRAASNFDEVRYLDREGRQEAYAHLCALDERLSTAPPTVLKRAAELHA